MIHKFNTAAEADAFAKGVRFGGDEWPAVRTGSNPCEVITVEDDDEDEEDAKDVMDHRRPQVPDKASQSGCRLTQIAEGTFIDPGAVVVVMGRGDQCTVWLRGDLCPQAFGHIDVNLPASTVIERLRR